jgi:hypothetical protein
VSTLVAAGRALGATGLVMLVVAHYLGRRAVTAPDPDVLRTEVRTTLDRDGWTASVRIYRERTGAGLLEAHDAVRRIARDDH